MSPSIGAIVGSLREESVTRVGLERSLDAAAAAGANTALLDLRTYDLPVYDADHRDVGDAEALRAEIQALDAVLLGTPVYHGSYSAPLKNALDYCGFDEFEHTTVGLLAVAGGGFPLPALDHLRGVLRALDAWVLPFQAAIPDSHEALSDGRLVDPEIEERLDTLGRRIVEYANIEPDPISFEGKHNVGGDLS
ncbi:NADPH-dependent FMN reductase [Halodesulfurarchaeum sp. HSR-GB]|uniref:NADPH-dependent FMN reductase n=1 Tax=Halodesulfurarchaeum sp. HSR-GB TaxID=3074077 RepID=UPI0028612705|nr:NADPH-dependent FMN reductase [Halodesulfurarchaeum sp. HSR-GB]MDR5657551.1 NADPH-dependent FMN reductase [Halodesulfurarchaeum sp. HSR-GB]